MLLIEGKIPFTTVRDILCRCDFGRISECVGVCVCVRACATQIHWLAWCHEFPFDIFAIFIQFHQRAHIVPGMVILCLWHCYLCVQIGAGLIAE